MSSNASVRDEEAPPPPPPTASIPSWLMVQIQGDSFRLILFREANATTIVARRSETKKNTCL